MFPERGFPEAEHRARTQAAQAMMAEAGLSALLLTTEPEIFYFTGFLTRFWESPTRPWFVVLPAAGKPVAVIPAIGEPLMRTTWLTDIRTWQSPDYEDDGVSLLSDTLLEVSGRSGRIGVPSGGETHLRMPLGDWERLGKTLGPARIGSDGGITRRLRMVKSDAEVVKLGAACKIADRAFARVGGIVASGMPLSEVFRRFQVLCLEEGADAVPYLAGAAAQGGYPDVISPATDKAVRDGDVLMLDTGLVRDGYFCDFDRNFSIGDPAPAVAAAHERLMEATAAGFEAARPGATAAQLFHAMDSVLTGGTSEARPGRLGHGLGLQLTEPPSLLPVDETELLPGMVLTLEPVIALGSGRMLVHEENIVIREDGAAWLSAPSGPHIEVLPA